MEPARYARTDARPYESAYIACRHYVARSGDSRAAVLANGSHAHCSAAVKAFKAQNPDLAAVSDFSVEPNP